MKEEGALSEAENWAGGILCSRFWAGMEVVRTREGHIDENVLETHAHPYFFFFNDIIYRLLLL